jgi:hypothetical protein
MDLFFLIITRAEWVTLVALEQRPEAPYPLAVDWIAPLQWSSWRYQEDRRARLSAFGSMWPYRN